MLYTTPDNRGLWFFDLLFVLFIKLLCVHVAHTALTTFNKPGQYTYINNDVITKRAASTQ